MASQTELIARYLKRYHSITSMFAFRRFGCTRLAHVIHILRKRGQNITTYLVPYGNTRYARYVLR